MEATFEDDMPALNDARRVVRIAMVLDEIRRIALHYRRNSLHDIRTRLSDGEFFICGGKVVEGREYSFYRQLVYAKRDADAYTKRGTFPCAAAAQKAIELYEFYASDNECVDDASKMAKDQGLNKIAFVLRRFRRFMRNYPDLASDEARVAFLGLQLTKDEFVGCSGHRTVSSRILHPFYRQVVLAKRDMQRTLKRGRFPKSKLLGMPSSISTDDEGNPVDEEDVDRMDGDCSKGKATQNESGYDDDFEGDGF